MVDKAPSWRPGPTFWEKDAADGSMIKRAIGFVIYFAERLKN
jgi:hypothetical protein